MIYQWSIDDPISFGMDMSDPEDSDHYSDGNHVGKSAIKRAKAVVSSIELVSAQCTSASGPTPFVRQSSGFLIHSW